MGQPIRRRRRVRSGVPAGRGPDPGSASAGAGPAPATAAEPEPTTELAPETRAAPPGDPEQADPAPAVPAPAESAHADLAHAERGLRGLVGSGSSQVKPATALRARDAARPRPVDLARARTELTIVRRNWTPPPAN